MRDIRRIALSAALASATVAGCAADSEPTPDPEPTAMAVGETRTVEVRFLRLDVQNFNNELDLEDLRAMPKRILQDVWLLDLDATPLMLNSLEQLRGLPPEEVDELPLAAQNMRTLLLLTPDNADLDGTNLEQLIGLSAGVGIPPAKALANLLSVEVTEDFIPPDIVGDVMMDGVIASHPNAQFRKGRIDDEHPDGVYAVTPRALPITLYDVVTNFEGLADRFGPVGDHPGFIDVARGFSVIEDEFKMVTRVNANALPFKGIDLTSAGLASVNSINGQIETVHDFSDPDWLTLEGMVENPTVEELVFTVRENDAWIPGGTAREPIGQGDSPGWDLPPWEMEALILEMARRKTNTLQPHCHEYELATGVVAFNACVDDVGWVTLETFNNVGAPPPPAYLWDLDVEIAEVRLHDGGLAEGEGDVQVTLKDVPIGVPPEEIVQQIKSNIEANPEALREFAAQITDSTVGDADFYFYRAGTKDGPSTGDYLVFVGPDDLRIDDDGNPVRDYGYQNPGFFADAGLTQKISNLDDVDGDTTHEKLRIEPGDVVFVQDDEGRVFEIAVGEKPSPNKLSLDVTRVQ